MTLRESVAVVTGGDSGIGRSTLAALSAAGATAVSWDLAGEGIRCDVTDPHSVGIAMAETISRFGHPTVLVASAGVSGMVRIADITPEHWDQVYAVNVRGSFLCLQAFARQLEGTELTGSVVLVWSVNGIIADPAHSLYSSTKAAVMHLARCAAVELGPVGIRVNAIAPGPTDTPMLQKALVKAGYEERIVAGTPLGRVGRPEDIASAIVTVLDSEWITGQVIAVDGGASLATARGAENARQLAAGDGTRNAPN